MCLDKNQYLYVGVDFDFTVYPFEIFQCLVNQVTLREVEKSVLPVINANSQEILNISFDCDVEFFILNALNGLVNH